MDIGKPLRIHNIPDPHRRKIQIPDWEENPYFRPDKGDVPVPVPNWPVPKKKPAEVEVEPN